MKRETMCIQAGYEPKNGESRMIPIVQSTTFKYDTSEDMGKLFDLEASGYFYSRLQNPTNDYVAAKICALEGGSAAMLTSSGQAASFFSIFNICGNGDHVVCSSTIYGGTYNLFAVTMKRMGIEFTFVDPDCSDEELEAAFQPNTKAVFGETIANPTAQLMRDLGAIQAPMNAYLLNLGIESLHVRMPRHCENAQKVAEFLEAHDCVTWVNYPGLPGNKYYERAKKYMPNGTCGVISFGVKGGRAAAEKFMKELKVAMIATHVADAHTCVLHPASATHRQMNDEELVAAGVGPDLIRLSIGIENVDDILADVAQALEACR